jgi:hypothetical protein
MLSRGVYWWRQEEVCRSVQNYPITVVKAGNGVGKTFLLAGLLLWFGASHVPCKVIATAPTESQVRDVLWAEVQAAYASARYPLGGRMKGLRWDLGENWFASAFGSGSVESKSGRHAGDMLGIIDESSGVDPDVHSAMDSLNCSRYIHMGNPLRPDGKFYELCELSADNPKINVITIPSLESPHIHLERSPHGMADATWLALMKHQYGADSIWWLSHILAKFPGQAEDGLIEPGWLDLASQIIHVASGPRRVHIDLAKGNGGDLSVVLCRDDNGLCDLRWSRDWDLGKTAEIGVEVARKWGVEPWRLTYDAAVLGTDFHTRLAPLGFADATPYLGGNSGGRGFVNLRSACGWALRMRLKPDGTKQTPEGLYVPQAPFAIRKDWMALLRPELLALRYHLEGPEKTALETKEDVIKRLRHSPDFADALMGSFAFPG